MIIRTYGIYDTVAKTLRSTFVSENDDVCLRSVEATASDPRADRATLKDCVVKYLYSVDSSTGCVVDVDQKDIIAFAAVLDKIGPATVDEKTLGEIKGMFDSLKKSYDSMGESFKQQSSINEGFAKAIENLSKQISDIIGGNIKCQKYKKHKAR